MPFLSFFFFSSVCYSVNDICGNEISACCLDNRRRKIVIGDVGGSIAVYNAASGGLMKSTFHDNFFIVVSLQYIDDVRRFIAAYKNGVIRLYDESGLEDCHLLMSFETSHGHLELLNLVFNPIDFTIATVGASSDSILLWDYYAGKLEQEIDICEETEHVVQITCLTPYPIVSVSDSIGNVLLFGSRGCTWSGKRISGFMNQIPLTAEYEEVPSLSTEEEERPLRAIIFTPPPVVSSFTPVNQSRRNSVKNRLRGERGSVGNILKRKGSTSIGGSAAGSPDRFERSMSVGRGDRGSVGSISSVGNWTRRGSLFSDNGANESDSDDGEDDIEDWQSSTDFVDRKATEECVRNEFAKSEVKWGKVTPAQAMGWDERTMQMYTVDALGNLRSFCLKDVIQNMKRTFDLKKKSSRKASISDLCRRTPQHHLSAMPPYPQKGKNHLLGIPNDATSYIGIKFNWSVEAHSACILNCKVIPDGVLTSAADKLVKMWSFDGFPLGVLIQSVPEGMKSRLWSLKIDVEPAMVRESLELDGVITKVHDLVVNTQKPELDEYDFYGIEPGENSTTFSRSELRQRIEKTSVILGVDFSHSSGKGFADCNESGMANCSPVTFDGTYSAEYYGMALHSTSISCFYMFIDIQIIV